ARLIKSQLVQAFQGKYIEKKNVSLPSRESRKPFAKITQIALHNDQLLNKTIGKCLQENGIIKSFKIEAEYRGRRIMKSDLLCETENGSVRLEFAWREWVTDTDISRYVLEKLQKYGQAVGLLE
ncbi:MAG: hypothetical protein ACKOQ2_25920, partial [Dolichospermum sp.]